MRNVYTGPILFYDKDMRIDIKTTNIELTEALDVWVRMKLEPLERLMDILREKDVFVSGKEDERVNVWVEIGKTTREQRKGDVFRAEIQMRLPHKSIRVTAVTDDLRKSINEARDKLQRELKEYQERRRVQD